MPYYRRDQKAGVSPPDLSKTCTFAEHIVHARGKRTKYTSVSLDPARITDLGEVSYRLKQPDLQNAGHILVQHPDLITELRRVALKTTRGERLQALRALRYATRRREGLVDWRFNIASVARKNLLAWAKTRVAAFFVKV